MRQAVAYALFAIVALTPLAAAGNARADDGNAAAGATDFKKICGVCHTAEAGKNRVGPSLFGVVGRASGTAPGFNYSAAMKSAGLTWTPENLEKYIADPKAIVPGNKMTYPGVRNPDERRDIIAYLATLH